MDARLPRQNRVNPWGEIVATPARGAWMGNRGALHNAAGRIVRHHRGMRWIICVLRFKGRQRTLMTPGHYTELFFLDEATALAAGHRPCAECQRPRFDLFRRTWAAANPGLAQGAIPSAAALDAALHAERIDDAGRKVVFAARLGDLPFGTLVAGDEPSTPWLVGEGRLWRWSFAGYTPGPVWEGTRAVGVLTPASVVRTLAAGYPVQVHPSAGDRQKAVGSRGEDFTAKGAEGAKARREGHC